MKEWIGIFAITGLLLLGGCKKETGPNLTGAITLSSQLHGTESYYINGYSFEEEQMYPYPEQGGLLPDIINEGYLIIDGEEQISLPGFNTPTLVNGFALVGSFSSWEEASDFYDNYAQVEEGLVYETVSEVVEIYQVWIQKTSANKYVKIIVRDVQQYEAEDGSPYNEVSLEYTYSPDGSTEFSCGCN